MIPSSIFIPLVVVLFLFLLFYGRKGRNPEESESTDYDPILPATVQNPFVLPGAEEDAEPHFAFIDVQTNGLIGIDGSVPDILQIAWIITDKEMNAIKVANHYITPSTLGPPSARAVHHITPEFIRKYGEDENDVMQLFVRECAKVPHWVMHNAGFDTQVILHSCSRNDIDPMLSHIILHCTMTYYQRMGISDEAYESLIDMASQMIGYAPEKLARMDNVAWRNVCLTRVVYRQLTMRHGIDRGFSTEAL